VYGVQRLGRLLDGGSTQLPGDCVIGCLSISWAMSGIGLGVVAVLFAVDDSWRVGWLAGWPA